MLVFVLGLGLGLGLGFGLAAAAWLRLAAGRGGAECGRSAERGAPRAGALRGGSGVCGGASTPRRGLGRGASVALCTWLGLGLGRGLG